MEQLKGGETHSLETMRLFFVGDLPASRPLQPPKPPRQARIFDQFAHREMFRKMRSRNARSFKPLQTLEEREGSESPRKGVVISMELSSQSQCPSPCSSYLLKEKAREARARLPNIANIMYSRSVAEVIEMIGCPAQKQASSPALDEGGLAQAAKDEADLEQLQSTQSTAKKECAKEKLVKLVDLVLPIIHQGLDLDRGDQGGQGQPQAATPTISTECPSPGKRSTSRNSNHSTSRADSSEQAKQRVKSIVEDIVRKNQEGRQTPSQSPKKQYTRTTPARQNLRVSVPRIDLALPSQPQELEQADHPKVPPRKGYIVHDEVCFSYWQANRRNPRKEPSADFRTKPPAVSAEQYCILDTETLEFLHKQSTQDEIEIASLSKIVTALLSILVCRKYGIDMATYKCRVSDEAADMPGTTAELETGDVLTVEDLLFGLLLPSGNDAAVVLAESLGRVIQKNRKKPSTVPPARTFVKHMNLLYREMLPEEEKPQEVAAEGAAEGGPSPPNEAQVHQFQNPSGLSSNPNRTTAEQITLVSAVALRNPAFRQIVSTKEYEVSFRNDRYGLARKLTWRNTNKLLWKDWEGVKTGTTETAGHCFVGKYGRWLVSVFDCATLGRRFVDAARLMDWVAAQTGPAGEGTTADS